MTKSCTAVTDDDDDDDDDDGAEQSGVLLALWRHWFSFKHHWFSFKHHCFSFNTAGSLQHWFSRNFSVNRARRRVGMI